ncbi:hypothetical protein ABK040_016485 [Willaertia magna]
MIKWSRQPLEFKTIAKSCGEENENYKLKKGLFIFSLNDFIYTTRDYLQEKLISFVINNDYNNNVDNETLQNTLQNGDNNKTLQKKQLLSQLDRIECSLLDKFILNNYKILFIGQKVNLSKEMITILNNLIENTKIKLIFLNGRENDLLFQLNYLKKIENINYFKTKENIFQLNYNILSKLTNSSITLQNFYCKHYSTFNNYNIANNNNKNNNQNNNIINIDLVDSYYMNQIHPFGIKKLNDWHHLLKTSENYFIGQLIDINIYCDKNGGQPLEKITKKNNRLASIKASLFK